MFPGVTALFERSLRVDARAWGPHLTRFGLMAMIYVAIIVAVEASSMFGAPGLRFFRTIAYLDLTFMTLLGIIFFSTAITEEKEEDTLGLMLMAGISPLGILLGKSGGRLVQALLLVAVQYPFTLLAITMGGITQAQIQATYVALFAYLIMLSGVGLLFSTLAPRNRSASTYLLLVVLAYVIGPLASRVYLANNATSTDSLVLRILEWVSQSSVFLEMGTVLTTGLGETVFTPQVITSLALGGLGFLLSWALFDFALQDPSPEASTRGLVTRSAGSRRWRSPGRPWINPIAWKDFHFVTGGKPAILIRLLFYALLYLISLAITDQAFTGRMSGIRMQEVTGMYLTLSMFAVSIDAALLVSRALHEEIRSQTLATLLLLPTTSGRILYAKLGGSLLGWLPSAVCFFGGMLLLPDGPQCVIDFFEGAFAAPFWLVAHLVLLPHLTAVIAMYARWGATFLAIGGTIGYIILEVLIFEATGVPPNSPFLFFVGVGNLALCGVCHIVVWLRAEALASR